MSGIQKLLQNRRWANGIRVEYFPRIQYVAAQWRSQTFIVEIRWDTREFHRNNPNYVDVQRYFLWIRRQRTRMSGECQTRLSVRKKIWKRTMVIHWSWFWEKWYSISKDSPQGIWDNIAEKMLLEFAESGCPIFRATSPLSRGQLRSKGHGKLSIHCAADLETVETIFRIIVSANQLSLYGAIAEICEEHETLHERIGRPVVMGQSSSSLVLSVIKTEVPLDCDDPANQDLLLQQYGERIEKLSQQDKVSKFCMDAGFLNVVENGQYFRTKDTADLSQFHAVACREYTLPREEEASQPKGRIQGNTKIGPVLEVATSYLHGKYGVEIKNWSLNRDNTHSWVWMSHGSNRFLIIWTTMRQKFQKISSKNMR